MTSFFCLIMATASFLTSFFLVGSSDHLYASYIAVVLPVSDAHSRLLEQLDARFPVVSMSCSSNDINAKVTASYYIDFLCHPQDFISDPTILQLELLVDNAQSTSDADIALDCISRSVALLYDDSELSIDAFSLLNNFIKLSWSPIRLINLNEGSYTSESLTRAIKTERKAKLNFAKSANDIDIVIQDSPFEIPGGFSSHASFLRDLSQMNLRNWPLITQSACENVLSQVEIAVLSNVNISTKYIHHPVRPRLLCLTYTISQNHDAVRNILSTWGSKCDGYLAFSNLSDQSISTIKLSLNDGWEENYNKIWEKVGTIWAVIAETMIDDFDWFIIGGDDLYVIVDNLRSLLQSRRVTNLSRNGSKPVYIGRILQKNSYLKFASGGRALKLLYFGLISRSMCMRELVSSMEDVLVANCLLQFGVEPIDTRDNLGLERFHAVGPEHAYLNNIQWYQDMAVHVRGGKRCCSSESASFHLIKSSHLKMHCIHSQLVHQHMQQDQQTGYDFSHTYITSPVY